MFPNIYKNKIYLIALFVVPVNRLTFDKVETSRVPLPTDVYED